MSKTKIRKRVRIAKWGKDHFVSKKGAVTLCGLMIPWKTFSVRGDALCVDCKRIDKRDPKRAAADTT